MTAEDEARRAIRICLLFWTAAVLAWAVIGLRCEDPVLVVVVSILAAVGFGLGWHGGLTAFDLLFKVGWICFGRRTPWAVWREASLKALRTLPWAGAAGAILWLVYALGPFRGWPGDAIMGSLANVIAAGVYGSILLAWRRVLKT